MKRGGRHRSGRRSWRSSGTAAFQAASATEAGVTSTDNRLTILESRVILRLVTPKGVYLEEARDLFYWGSPGSPTSHRR
jgi:hypothetical protein